MNKPFTDTQLLKIRKEIIPDGALEIKVVDERKTIRGMFGLVEQGVLSGAELQKTPIFQQFADIYSSRISALFKKPMKAVNKQSDHECIYSIVDMLNQRIESNVNHMKFVSIRSAKSLTKTRYIDFTGTPNDFKFELIECIGGISSDIDSMIRNSIKEISNVFGGGKMSASYGFVLHSDGNLYLEFSKKRGLLGGYDVIPDINLQIIAQKPSDMIQVIDRISGADSADDRLPLSECIIRPDEIPNKNVDNDDDDLELA